MRGIESDVVALLKMARGEYRMTYREIGEVVGVQKYMVYRWEKGTSKPTAKNYGKVREMVMKLSGRDIRYAGQAYDILVNG